jgi:protein-tyrosine phosphatase
VRTCLKGLPATVREIAYYQPPLITGEAPMNTILFVCTGNTCRSPMAEAVAQQWLDGEMPGGVRYLAVSAGVAAAESVPATAEAIAALADVGITHDGRSKALTADMIANARHVLCMTEGHAELARALVHDRPADIKKIATLDPAGDVSDPIGYGQEAYDALVRHFRTLIPERLQEVLSHEDRAGVGSPGG